MRRVLVVLAAGVVLVAITVAMVSPAFGVPPPKLKKENPGYEHCGGISNCPTHISVGGGPK